MSNEEEKKSVATSDLREEDRAGDVNEQCRDVEKEQRASQRLEKNDQATRDESKEVHFENILAKELADEEDKKENNGGNSSINLTTLQKQEASKTPNHEGLPDRFAKGDRYSLQRSDSVGLLNVKSKADLTNERELKVALYCHISNPLKRWKVGRYLPWSMILQITKTVVVLIHAVLFIVTVPNERSKFFIDSRDVFENLFIKSFETNRLIYTAFTPQQLLSEINYASERYYQLPQITIGSFNHQLDDNGDIVPITATLRQYKVAELSPSTDTFVFDRSIITDVFNLTSGDVQSITNQLASNGIDFSSNRFVDLQLTLPVKSIWITNGIAQCFYFSVQLLYTNAQHNGKISYSLKSGVTKLQCNGTILSSTASQVTITAVTTVIDIFVIILSIMSMILIAHTLVNSYKLGKALRDFYRDQLQLNLSIWDRLSLFSVWLMFSLFTDILLFVGSASKIGLEFNASINTTSVRILLGTALVVQAGTVLRYASYFKQLNTLTRTLNKAFPDLLKFLLCTSILFFAFAISGFVVFEPYNERFINFPNALESLFVLVNGDDIFPTFRSFSAHPDDIAVYIYSRIFVYIFVALFVTAVLNLFTSLIITSYESTLKLNRATINEVRRFIFSGPLTPGGVALRDITFVKKYVDPSCILDKQTKKKASYHVELTQQSTIDVEEDRL